MEIHLLGTLEVVDGDVLIDVRRPRERTVLAMLAAEADRPVSTGRLMQGLWGDDLPASAAKTLQSHVHHLRSLLPSGSITTEGPAYRLRVAPENVDLFGFSNAVRRARELGGEPERAAALLESALGMWRGAPLGDASDVEWIVPLVTRLEEERVQAQADLIQLRIDLGHHEEVLGLVRSLLDEHHLREDLWRLYMLALYRSGRQAEALRAFSEARRRLVEELGVEPGPALQRLEEEILSHDPSLLAEPDSPPRRSAPSAALSAGSEPRSVPEQRLVTVIAAELLGWRSLIGLVGEAGLQHVGSEAVEAMREIVRRFGGTVQGESEWGLRALFGAPIAREDDTYRAIRAAIQINSEIQEQSREIVRSWGGQGVDSRVAVSSAHLRFPADGSPDLVEVDPAMASLLGRGERGSVVVDDHTRTLMEGLFDWSRLDGAEDPAWEVRGIRQGADKARVGRRLRAPLTGRDGEVATFARRLDSLARGVGGVLVISGEAGVGKTRLVDEMRGRHPGITWMVGHGAAYAEAIPYWPYRDLFRSWLGVGIDDTDLQVRVAMHHKLDGSIPDLAAEVYPYLGGLLGVSLEPDQARRLDLASEALQFRTFEVIETILGGLAERDPVVLVLEDLHWADPTSLQLTDQLLTLTEERALLIVLTTRPEPDHASRQVVSTARGRYPHRFTEMHLGSLSEDAQRSMLDALVGAEALPASVAESILRLAEGNPFYLEELIGALIDQGALVAGSSGWELHGPTLVVPETVEKVVQARIDGLDPPSRELLTAASILGRSFGLPLLQGVVGESGAPVDVIQNLLRLDLLVEARRWPQSEYLFRHALIQEAAYRTITEERRVELHRRAAGWLERRHQSNEDEVMGMLARHWRAAGDDEKAASALMRAGDLARRDHALDEAIGHYRELMALLERRGDRRTMALVLFKLALALHNSLRFEESNRIYQRAFELWEPPASPEPTATLRFSGPPFTRVPDPVRSFTLPDIQLQMALFDRLVERWPDDTLVPSLAERWEVSPDGLRYRFLLREGLTWSDGRPLTAHDVEYGIKRNLDPDRPGVGVAMFYVLEGALERMRGGDPDAVGVQALDDRTVEFRLVNPAPYFLAMLNRPDSGPQPRHAIEAKGDDWGRAEHEVVSGAFRRQEHSDESTVLERRPDYQGWRHGNVGVVEWRHGSPAGILADYVDGNSHLAWITGLFEGTGLDRVAPEEVVRGPSAALIYLAFVFGRPLPDQRPLRLALAHCIDRGALVTAVPSHATAATGGVVPPMLAGHTPDIAPAYDPELARRLLSTVEIRGPLRILNPSRPQAYLSEALEVVVATWREQLDLAIEVLEVDFATYAEMFADPSSVDLFPATWYPGYTDPEYYLRLLLHSDASANYGGFSYEPYDRAVEGACAARDERTRLAMFHEADRMAVAEQAAVLPLTYDGNLTLARPGVEGWWEFGKSWSNFADITLPGR
ncbi:MAG: ABC transporter substrate-binding protein [Actinomycetota bacterium]